MIVHCIWESQRRESSGQCSVDFGQSVLLRNDNNYSMSSMWFLSWPLYAFPCDVGLVT